jgi:hypothetical protein
MNLGLGAEKYPYGLLQNDDLLDLSNEILALTRAIHSATNSYSGVRKRS